MTSTPASNGTQSAARSWPGQATLTGTGRLLRFMLRRDRVRTTVWVMGIGLAGFYFAHAVRMVAADHTELASLASMYADPIGRMMVGPGFGMDAPTYERFFSSGYVLFLYILFALFSVFTVVRHTRAEEQTGRAELARSNVVGRHATLSSVLILTTLGNLLAAAIVWTAAISAEYGAQGSILVAAGGLAVGLFFTGAATVAAQLSAFSRGSSAIAGGLLGLAYMIRMGGDAAEIGGSGLSWASPLGWAQQTAPYVKDRWWPLTLLIAGAVICTVLGYWLSTRRDVEAGLMPTRLGRSRATPWLGSPIGLAARNLRGNLRGWGIALLLVGLMYGAFAQSMVDAAEDLPDELSEVFAGDDLMLGYMAYIGLFMAVFIAAAGVSGIQQLRGEEIRGRAEYALSAPIGRITWLGAHLAVLVMGLLLILAGTGLGMGLGAVLSLDQDGGQYFGELFLASMLQAPAVLATVGIVAAVFGWIPRVASVAGWIIIGFAAVMTTFGGLLELPEALRSLNIFGHLAEYPVDDIAWAPILWLSLIAVCGIGLGLAGCRRREVNRI